jgi:Ca2+:H+ antiporter
VAKRILWALLALAPVTIAVDLVAHPGDTLMFVLAAASLIPLAWLIGESTEHAAEHTGPGIGGFLNASFGNAPELIIALFAVQSALPEVVRGSLAGSVVSNLLLVFAVGQLIGPDRADLDRGSLLLQLGLTATTVVLVLPAVAVGYAGDPERDLAVWVSVPIAAALLGLYVFVTTRNLRRHRRAHSAAPMVGAWSLRTSLIALAAATVTTAFISEILVHSLDAFARAVGASDFFVAFVIVAIVGNAAEHGGAVVIARTGNMRLASEIAIASSAQVALFVAPAVMLLSLFFANPIPFAFRWEEMAAMAAAVIVTGIAVRDGISHRREGAVLLAVYALIVVGVAVVGDR